MTKNCDAGDRFPLRDNSERRGTGKLRSHWEDNIYIVFSIQEKGSQ